MNKIIFYWNFIYYLLFSWHVRLYNIINRLNPIWYFNNTTVAKSFFKRNGIKDMNELTTETIFNNPVKGVNKIWAHIYINSLGMITEFTFFNFVQILIVKSLTQYIFSNQVYFSLFILYLIIPIGVFNYVTLFKNHKYLTFFRQFQKLDNEMRNRHIVTSTVIIALILITGAISFYLATNNHSLFF
jgi:hypothetical protein